MRSLAPILAVLLLWLASGCKKDEPSHWGDGAPDPTPEPGVQVVSEDGLALLADVLPASSQVLLTVDLPHVVERLGQGFGPVPAPADPEVLRGDLGEQTRRLLGANLLRARAMVGFAALSEQAVGVVFAGDWAGATLPGKARDVGGGARAHAVAGLWIARVGGHLVLGNQAAVASVQAVASGATDSLAGSERLARHRRGRELVVGQGPGTVLSLDMAAAMALGAPPVLRGVNLDIVAAALYADGAAVAAASIEPATREPVRDLVSQTVSRLRGRLKGLYASAQRADGLAEALTGVLAYHFGAAALDRVSIEEPEGWIVVRGRFEANPLWMAGALAPWVVRAYVDHQQRILTSEGASNVGRIARGALAWYTAEPPGPSGARTCTLPEPVGPTPEGSPCDHPGDAYPASAGDWDHPTWEKLGFRPGGDHRFRYTFSTNGQKGAAAVFTVRAEADLDCDGVWSSFERRGFGRATDDEGCVLDLSDDLTIERELE